MEIRLKITDVERIVAAVKGPDFATRLRAAGRIDGDWLFVTRADYAAIYNSTGVAAARLSSPNAPRQSSPLSGQYSSSSNSAIPLRLGDMIEKLAKPIAKALHLGCLDPASQQLKPESPCAQRRDKMNAWDDAGVPRFDLHGGLGDCFLDLFERPAYRWLCDMKETDRVRVVFWCSNPFASELFAWHPKRGQIEVLACQNWTCSSDDQACAKALGIKPPRLDRQWIPRVPEGGLTLEFFPSPADLVVLQDIQIAAAGRPIVMLAPGAGEPVRNIPTPILTTTICQLLSANFFLVQVGRNYARGARQEPPVIAGAYDVLDRLSVPGTARLLQSSAGLVTAHSSLNLLGWFLRKPQLVLAPDRVFGQHLARPSRWGFGAWYPETMACRFEEFRDDFLGRFATLVHSTEKEKQVDEIWS